MKPDHQNRSNRSGRTHLVKILTNDGHIERMDANSISPSKWKSCHGSIGGRQVNSLDITTKERTVLVKGTTGKISTYADADFALAAKTYLESVGAVVDTSKVKFSDTTA